MSSDLGALWKAVVFVSAAVKLSECKKDSPCQTLSASNWWPVLFRQAAWPAQEWPASCSNYIIHMDRVSKESLVPSWNIQQSMWNSESLNTMVNMIFVNIIVNIIMVIGNGTMAHWQPLGFFQHTNAFYFSSNVFPAQKSQSNDTSQVFLAGRLLHGT